MTDTAARHPVKIVQLFPDLLGTYGDGGNAIVLGQRLAWRDIPARVIDVTTRDDVPADAQLYVIGGGEDGPQGRAATLLEQSGALHHAVAQGAAVLAVCAGFQILGNAFLQPDGTSVAGLGLLDVVSRRGPGKRIVGELVTDPPASLGLPPLTGYENHGGVTELGADATPLGQVRVGVGNMPDAGVEGALQGRIVATYMHGPVLARNPALADLLLAWALDVAPGSLDALDDARIDALRAARFRAANAHT